MTQDTILGITYEWRKPFCEAGTLTIRQHGKLVGQWMPPVWREAALRRFVAHTVRQLAQAHSPLVERTPKRQEV